MISVDRARGIYLDPGARLTVAHRYGRVYVRQDNRGVGMDTPTAVKVGLALARLSDQVEQGEFLLLNLDGEELHLLPDAAHRLGGALLRKADAADDWQRANR